VSRVRVLVAVGVVLDLLVSALALGMRTGSADVVVGRPPAAVRQALPTSTILAPPTAPVAAVRAAGAVSSRPMGRLPEPGHVPQMRQPDAQPYGPPIAFASDVETPDHLVFILIAGSDARPGERVDRSRADAIHLLAINPQSGTGTLLGIPRDTYVEIPGHGRGKINTSMAIGGPDLLAETVQHVTGLPVDWCRGHQLRRTRRHGRRAGRCRRARRPAHGRPQQRRVLRTRLAPPRRA
jgi:hypothetical protein